MIATIAVHNFGDHLKATGLVPFDTASKSKSNYDVNHNHVCNYDILTSRPFCYCVQESSMCNYSMHYSISTFLGIPMKSVARPKDVYKREMGCLKYRRIGVGRHSLGV